MTGSAATPLQRVSARVHSGALVSPVRMGRGSPAPTEPVRLPVDRSSLALPVAAAAGVVLVGGGALSALVVAVLAVALRRVRRLPAQGRFGFGDGFLPYHADDGWPAGVQEDDDMHWRWPSGG